MSELVNQRVRKCSSPDEGGTVWLRKLGIRFLIGGEETHGNFALVEYLIGARALAAPMHTHEREDEHTYVLEGEIGVQIGEEVLVAQPGDLVFKPREFRTPSGTRQMSRHGRWKIISPAGFERYFAELAPLLPPASRGPLDEEAVGAVRGEVRGSRWTWALSPCSPSATALRSTRHRLPGDLLRQPACRGSDTLVP